MTRRKVELAWITNQSARRASLKKRRVGLLKKVLELTTLYGIKACLVMYNPGEQEPMTWPSLDEAKELIKKFYFVLELERSKRTMTMEIYMTEKLSKVQNDLTKLNMKNKEAGVGQYMLQIHHGKMMDDFNAHELEALIWFRETRRTILRKRVEFYKQVSYPLAGPSEGDVHLQPLPQGPTTPYYDIGSAIVDIGDSERVTAASLDWDNWFHNIMNPNEFRGGGSSIGGSSSVAPQLIQPSSSIGGSSIAAVVDLGLPGSLIGGSSSATAVQGQPRHPFGGDYLGPFGGHDGESSSNAIACSDGSEMEPSEERN
ncbi:hypothetical protein V6N13_073312 [Hibiscus sabdariffa]